MKTHGHGRFHSVSLFLWSVTALAISSNVLADAAGKARYSGIVPGKICTSCHTGTAPVAIVTIAGPTAVAAGSVNSYTVTVQGGPAIAAGFNLAANAGTLSANDVGTKLVTTEIVHSAPRPMTGGAATFTISWKAPAVAGPATLFAAGVSTNGDTTDKGDGVGSTSLAITVGAGAGTGTGPATPPVAVIKAPASGVAGIPFSFDGSASTAVAGPISQYNWNFGDNTAGSGATVTHAFAAGGYTVRLTVTDSAGATNTAAVAIAVSTASGAPPPVANPKGPTAGEINVPVQFDGTGSTDAAGPIASYNWNFGDGTTDVGPQPIHTFTTEGTFNVALTVTNNAGVAATGQIPITIGPAGSGGGSAVPPLLGQTLFDDNCASCHGSAGGGGTGTGSGTVAPAIVGKSYKKIQDAIDNVPDMQPLADTLSKTDLKQVAGYLLYNTHCVSCHGPSGAGADDPAVVGTTLDAFKTALKNEVEMQPLADILSSTDIKEIVAYLNPPPAVSADSISAQAKGEASISSVKSAAKPKAQVTTGGLDAILLLLVGAWGVLTQTRRAQSKNGQD